MRNLPPLLAKSLAMLLLLAAGSVAVQVLCFSTSGEETDLAHQLRFNEEYNIFSLNLPNELEFCGERVPLELLDVRERLDRELLVNTYWQSNSLLAHKRANRWFPVIEPILKREGLPDDFKYLPLVESGFTNVVSPAGAAGYWQFMEGTARGAGLEVTSEVDERYNVVRSTEAACAYLKEAYARYGSWAMAAASYNLGHGNLQLQLGRQKQNDYFALLLPEETSRYVFRILAMKTIIGDPERYGFHLRPKDLYPPYRTRKVEVSAPVEDLNAFAVSNGTNYKVLKLLNPWMRDNTLKGKPGKTYSVLLPTEDFDKVVEPDE
ncbi:MAG: lytic transglycosylase domain-containing protein [Flavobacteriales bacterium]|nr:lytic transglycosylase domain-containing protein [Flavobacteriales bacterium]MBP9079860.1 lytic transglycosylase domain-containing protein [Flavobacteriales bacterium]